MKVIVLLVFVAAAYAAPAEDVVEFEMEEIEKITSFLQTKEDLLDFLTEGKSLEKVRVTSFSFKDCGGPMAMTAINSVSIMPDPISLPGTITVGTNFMIKKNFGMPLSIDLKIEKKVLGKFITVPCIDNFGSCTYGGLCGDLASVTCPDPLVKIGIDCRCPFKAASYTFPATGFEIDASLPLPSGDYQVRANAMSNGTVAACIDIIFTLK